MTGDTLHLRILSPEGTRFEGEVKHVVLPGEAGLFGIYPLHAPLISSLAAGTVRYEPAEGGEETFPVAGGFVEVENNRVTVCIETDEQSR